ncbi:MAG: helix-turn-helix domain-containing protein [Leptolyngbyaceae cyanobacterium]
MSGVLHLEVQESAATLKALMDEQSDVRVRSKVQILWWLKTGQASQVSQLARLSGYHRGSISRWLSQYRQGGVAALRQRGPRSGRPRAIAGEVRQALAQELQDPEGFQSYVEVQRWLAAVHGVQVPYKTVHKTVRYGLKAKLKVPRPQAAKQSEGAVEAFE